MALRDWRARRFQWPSALAFWPYEPSPPALRPPSAGSEHLRVALIDSILANTLPGRCSAVLTFQGVLTHGYVAA